MRIPNGSFFAKSENTNILLCLTNLRYDFFICFVFLPSLRPFESIFHYLRVQREYVLCILINAVRFYLFIQFIKQKFIICVNVKCSRKIIECKRIYLTSYFQRNKSWWIYIFICKVAKYKMCLYIERFIYMVWLSIPDFFFSKKWSKPSEYSWLFYKIRRRKNLKKLKLIH